MKKNTLIIMSLTFMIIILIFIQSCSSEETFSKEQKEQVRIEEMLIEAGFTKVENSIKEGTSIELKTSKEAMTFLENLKKNKKVTGKFKIPKGQIQKINEGKLILNANIKAINNNFQRTRTGLKEVFNFYFSIYEHPAAFDFTLECEKNEWSGDWKITNLDNVDAVPLDGDDIYVDSSGITNELEFYITLGCHVRLQWGPTSWTSEYRYKYEFEVEMNEYSDIYEAEIYFEGNSVAWEDSYED